MIQIDKMVYMPIHEDDELIIRSNIARVLIVTEPGITECCAHLYGKVNEVTNMQSYDLDIMRHGKTIEIKNRCKLSRGVFSRYLSLDCILPEFFRGKLNCSAAAGSIIIKSGQPFRELNINASGGIVNANELSAEKASLTSSAGSVTANKIRAGRVSLYSTRGNVEVGSISGEIYANTNEGKIELGLEQCDSKVELRSHKGDLKLRIAGEINASLSAYAPAGAVNCAIELEKAVKRRNRVTGTLGSGGSKITMQSTQGNVIIE